MISVFVLNVDLELKRAIAFKPSCTVHCDTVVEQIGTVAVLYKNKEIFIYFG